MSHPEYKHIGTVEQRAIEEMSEPIKAICKAQRFGWSNHRPDRPGTNNFTDAIDEIEDVKSVIYELEAYQEDLQEKQELSA